MMDSISFKDKSRQELLSVVPFNREEIPSFLSAVSRIGGSLEISKKKLSFVIQIDTYSEGLKVVELFQELYPAEFELNIETAKAGPRQGKQICSVVAPYGFTKQILFDLLLMEEDGGEIGEFIQGVPKQLLKTQEQKTAFLQGLYLACGSVYVPSTSLTDKKDGYHFEFQIDDEVYADETAEILEEFGIQIKKSERGESFLLYLKDKDSVQKMLVILGLSDCALALQSIIDERETANNLNRAIICETANLDKTYAACAKQLQAIGEISDKMGLDKLPPQLMEVIDARLENQQASLQELADTLGISKSCLNHRFRKIMEIAESLQE